VTDCLRIERLANTYLAPRGHPAPERLRSELDELARHRVSACCERALSELIDPRDRSVWVIDELNIDFLMDVSAAPPEELAAFWAAQIAQSLFKTFSAGPDGEHVIRFANRAEYLARFLRDLSDGRAWGQWYYNQFETLRNLPTNAAMREALFREPDEAESTLVHLHRTGQLKSITGYLSAFDQRLLVQLCSPEETTPTSSAFSTVLNAWRDLGPRQQPFDLELYAHMRASHPQLPPAEVRSSIIHLSVIARWMQLSQFNTLISSLQAGDVSEAMLLLPPQEQESLLFLYSLSAAEPAWIGTLNSVDKTDNSGLTTQERSPLLNAGVNTLRSSLGGLFLLLPGLVENKELMGLFGPPEDKMLRYLLLLACCGMHTGDVADDPALLLAAGLEAAPQPAALRSAQLQPAVDEYEFTIGEQDIEAFQTHLSELNLDAGLRSRLAKVAVWLIKLLAQRLPGLGNSSAGFLWRNVISGDTWFTVSPEKILVELSGRPLEIVMRMAGLHELILHLPWLPEQEVRIRFQDR
jgi:hypothetical protein